MSNNNDYVIANDTGQEVRLDIQDAFQQLASNNFGTTPPANSVFEHQWFANGDTGKLMYKDASTGNNASTNYFNLANLTGGLFVDQASTFNGDVVFKGTDSSGSFDITFDADNTSGRGALIFKDETRITLGTGNDFVISHLIDINAFAALTDKRTVLTTRTNNAAQECFLLQTQDSSDTDSAYKAYLNAGQHLFFNGSEKLATTANGIEVAGSILPTTDNDKPLGSSSKRFSTLHSGALNTGDINMSNLNDSGNEIDGSQGSWSIQEGSSDLFLINRVSGKKYKFNLTEVT
tara:strand:- start:731 stop:1603 length:873 start_codon:yes stop_codon:yes gene_type:complete